jgi:hypothetical protein
MKSLSESKSVILSLLQTIAAVTPVFKVYSFGKLRNNTRLGKIGELVTNYAIGNLLALIWEGCEKFSAY